MVRKPKEHVVNWEDDGAEIADFKPRAVIRNPGTCHRRCHGRRSVAERRFSAYPPGFIAMLLEPRYSRRSQRFRLLAFANLTASEQSCRSRTSTQLRSGQVAALPVESMLGGHGSH